MTIKRGILYDQKTEWRPQLVTAFHLLALKHASQNLKNTMHLLALAKSAITIVLIYLYDVVYKSFTHNVQVTI